MFLDSVVIYPRLKSEICPYRLLDVQSLRFADFNRTDEIPPYAVISHISVFPNNWQEHFDVPCSISIKLGIRYLWIDTGSDQGENDEFTKSRYAYYQNCAVCLVYLDDIGEWTAEWFRSKWFRREWTVTELVAPREQYFFDKQWRLLGSRSALAEGISATIGLGQNILEGAPPVSNVDIVKRLEWVQPISRYSLKPHDTVYCLMGILEVEVEVNYDESVEETFLKFLREFIQTHPHVPIPQVLEFLNWRCFLTAGYLVPPISWPIRESDASMNLQCIELFMLTNSKICPRRLIHTPSLQLVEFSDSKTVPSYAILSHRWIQEQEVSYQEFLQVTTNPALKAAVKKTAGYQKIQQACTLVRQLGLKYLWVDTCCIDKGDHTQVAHDIKSMYSYYRNSSLCLVYLFDVQSVDGIDKSEWFRRGWTLQELVAPREELFFSRNWNFIGSRRQNKTILSRRTGIQTEILEDKMSIRELSLGERIKWIQGRNTTKPQDLAYCLLDILDIDLEILYEEEEVETTFQRLQHQLVRKMEWTSDLSQLDLTWSFLSLGLPIPPVSWPICEYNKVWPWCFIDTLTVQLIDLNTDNITIPPYAIFSHSWTNREEACYQEFREAATDPDIKVNLERKFNYRIIQQACLMARQLGIQYLWTDICCIGKDKFSQDINSMFEYYGNSTLCLVYLDDHIKMGGNMLSSKWFKDGWTLQGLLAPQEEIFFDQNWTFIGTRLQIQHCLVSATSVPQEVFEGTMFAKEVDIGKRLEWIQGRQVAKFQDFVYCFMVILDVRMELYYDEPVERTLARFQDEFVRTHPEVSISLILEYLTWRFLAVGYPITPPPEWFSREVKACPPFFIDTSTLKIVHHFDGDAALPYAVLFYQWVGMARLPPELKDEKKPTSAPRTGIIQRILALKKPKEKSPAPQKEATEHSPLSEHSQLTELSRLIKSTNLSAFSIARQLGLQYLWIDTSSIRLDHVKLALSKEELESIHEYYRNSTACLVHLQNVEKKDTVPWREWFKKDLHGGLEESRETLFFNTDWSFRGSKKQFKNEGLYQTKRIHR